MSEDETVENRDGMSGGEELRNEDGTEIAGTAGDEDFHWKFLEGGNCQLPCAKSKFSSGCRVKRNSAELQSDQSRQDRRRGLRMIFLKNT